MLKRLKIMYIVMFFVFGLFFFVYGASLSFLPSDGKFIKNCPFDVDILLDTEGIATNTIDLNIFDDDSFDIVDMNVNNGIFPQYTPISINKVRYKKYEDRKVFHFMGTTFSQTGFIGTGKVVTLTIIPKKDVSKINLEWYMIPDYKGDDSNIYYILYDKVYDVLSKVNNAVFIVEDGICEVNDVGNTDIKIENIKLTTGANSIDSLFADDLLLRNINPLLETDKKYQKSTVSVRKNDDNLFSRKFGFKEKLGYLIQKIKKILKKIF